MKTIKEYKGVALLYLVLAIINVVCVINIDNPTNVQEASTERNIVMNA